MTLARIRIDRGAAVDERVEKGQSLAESEAFGSDFQDEERGVARGLHVERHELGIFEPGLVADLGRVNRDLLPGHGLGRAAGFEKQPPGGRIHLASARARRAHAISSPLTARSKRIATP